MEPNNSGPKTEFIKACQEGWRVAQAYGVYLQIPWGNYKLENNKFCSSVISTLLQQQLVYNHLFWTNETNIELAFTVDDNGDYTFNDLTNVEFKEWVIPRVPTVQQIYINAATKGALSKKIFVRFVYFVH